MNNNQSLPPKTKAQYWIDYVNNSRGAALLLPEKLKKEAQEIEKAREDFNKTLERVAKQEILLQEKTQHFWTTLRLELESVKPDIWISEIGWNKDALDEEVFVINVVKK